MWLLYFLIPISSLLKEYVENDLDADSFPNGVSGTIEINFVEPENLNDDCEVAS